MQLVPILWKAEKTDDIMRKQHGKEAGLKDAGKDTNSNLKAG